MNVFQSIRRTLDQNVGLIKKCFEEVVAGLESKEKQLKAVQESVTESSKELDLRRESIEEWVKQVMKKEEDLKEFQLVQEEGFRDLERKRKEMGSLLGDVKIREEKLHMQEKVIEGLFENIELEKGKLERIQKSIDEKLDEISRKERHVEENSERSKLEIEMRENTFAPREEKLVAKEKELEAKERILDPKTGKLEQPMVDNAEPGELRKQSRKRGRKDTDKEFTDQVNEVSSYPEASCAKAIVISDSSEPGSSSGNSFSSTKVYEFPDTEFYDFGKHRKKNCFAVNQVWAIFDEDLMPRRYAQIIKVYNQEFKLRIAWLEVDSKNQGEIGYHGFPVACGKFNRAESEEMTDIRIFSHQIHCERFGLFASSYLIYPRKGEIWALFRDWNLGSSSKSDYGKHYSYEIVKVISDFIRYRGIRVVYLDKIRAYVSLFQRAVQSAIFRIPAWEMFRFSHQIPCYQVNGTEGKGVPKPSFELDTAALPLVFCVTSCDDKDEVNSKRKQRKGISIN